MSALFALQQALRDAIRARSIAQDARRDFERKLTEEFRARLVRELEAGGYNERVHATTIAENEAQRLVEAEKERIALEETTHPYPLGTRMVEWEYPRLYRQETVQDRRLTGRAGTLEIITDKSEHPGNKTYGLADRGELVVRILKKDGTLSKTYERVNRPWSLRWVPEGTDLLQEDLSWPEPQPKPAEKGDKPKETNE